MTNETDLLSGLTPQGDPLTDLVGEGKKFKDASALAAAKLASDQFIEQLKAENAGLRGDLTKAKSGGDAEAMVQSLIERIEKATAAKPGSTDGGSETLGREAIEKLVRDGITAEQSQLNRRANYTKANAEILNHFKGDADQARKHLTERAGSLGLSQASLTEMAEVNPKMFRELMVPQHATQRTVTTLPPGKTGTALDQSTVRNAAYYSKLRKETGNKFWDPAVQQQMFRDRKELGAQFNAT